jgi:hypothetical protein
VEDLIVGDGDGVVLESPGAAIQRYTLTYSLQELRYRLFGTELVDRPYDGDRGKLIAPHA